MKLSKNLSLGEYIKSNTAERRGIDNSLPDEYLSSACLLATHIFQPIREHFGSPIYLSSGFRSDALNEAIGGSKTSFDQLIWEFGTEDRPNWVHVSYNPDGEQRGIILIAYKDNGRTKYKHWDR